jgi:DNA-binding CsgD family transcriptional regulator
MGTSVLWNSAPFSDTVHGDDHVATMWSYYSKVSISSDHAGTKSPPSVESRDIGGVRPGPLFTSAGALDQRRAEVATRLTRGGMRAAEAQQRGPFSLTQRELEVLQLLAEGSTNGEMSARLFISPKTTKNHLAAIFQKLDVTNRTQALVRAVVMGLVSID